MAGRESDKEVEKQNLHNTVGKFVVRSEEEKLLEDMMRPPMENYNCLRACSGVKLC